MNKIWRLGFVLVLCIGALMPVWNVSHAQDDDSRFTPEQRELIDTLNQAFTNVANLSAIRYVQTQTLNQLVSATDQPEVGEIITDLVQQIDSVVVFEEGDDFTSPSRVSQTIEQTLSVSGGGIGDQTIEQVLDVIYVDGTFYARINQISPSEDYGFPEGWFNWTENPAALPGVEVFNLEQLFSLSSIIPSAEIAEVAFEDVRLVDEYEEDGQTFQVIEVVWDVEELYKNALFGLNQALNLEALGISTEEFLPLFIEGSSFVYRVTINTTTMLPVSITSELTSSIELPAEVFGTPLTLEQTVINETQFIEVEEVPEIEPPVIEEEAQAEQ